MAKDEEKKEEVTITRGDFLEAVAKATTDEKMSDMLKDIPMLMLVLVMYGHTIEEYLFGDKNEKEEEE